MAMRDPNNVNPHVAVAFEDVFGEPDDINSFDCAWETSQHCYTCGKNCCYTFLSVCCGMCLALMWGFEFAIIAFQQVWCISPAIRLFVINCHALQRLFGNIVACFLAPTCESCGLLFSQITIHHHGKV